jgi:HD-GYP domain-containing protein (c-di-GMP phosphodiesterase class II)
MFLKSMWPFLNKHNKKQHQKKHLKNNTSGSVEKVYTKVSQLAVGMYVTELDRPWLETSFVFQGFELKTEEDIKAVRTICEYVYVDMTKTRKTSNPVAATGTQTSSSVVMYTDSPRPKLSTFEKEIYRSGKIYEGTSSVVSNFMEKIARGDGVDSKLAKEAVAECVNSVLHSPDAMLWLSQLKNKDEYTAQHSLNVCVLSIVLGRHLNFSEKDLNITGLCGMMHDMGKMLIPLTILNKPGKLEGEELYTMQSHTTLGYELLKSSDNMHRSAIETALIHHERSDGQGYPRQIKPSGISEFAKIVTIADMYDAITSDRVYQKGRTHLEAINIMTNMAGTHLDPALVVKFIESLGVYPPGCLVEMTNGAIAIVVECNEKLKLRPKIIIILDEEKNPVQEQQIIDLSKMIEDKRGNVYTIKGIVRAQDWNIDSSKYYREGILHKGFPVRGT